MLLVTATILAVVAIFELSRVANELSGIRNAIVELKAKVSKSEEPDYSLDVESLATQAKGIRQQFRRLEVLLEEKLSLSVDEIMNRRKIRERDLAVQREQEEKERLLYVETWVRHRLEKVKNDPNALAPIKELIAKVEAGESIARRHPATGEALSPIVGLEDFVSAFDDFATSLDEEEKLEETASDQELWDQRFEEFLDYMTDD